MVAVGDLKSPARKGVRVRVPVPARIPILLRLSVVNGIHLAAFSTTFLASAVEVVEAFTIVLAVGVIRGWRSALAGAGAAVAVLVVLVGVLGVALTTVIPIALARAVVGIFLLLLGLKWLRKAVLRWGGWTALHDEQQVFKAQVTALRSHAGARGALDWSAASASFNGVLLEGLEVTFIVIAFGTQTRYWGSVVLGALSAAVVVALAGLSLRRPLERVPENALKFIVGLALTTFGTQWTAEGVGGTWPLGDLATLYLIAGYLALSLVSVEVLRRSRSSGAAGLT